MGSLTLLRIILTAFFFCLLLHFCKLPLNCNKLTLLHFLQHCFFTAIFYKNKAVATCSHRLSFIQIFIDLHSRVAAIVRRTNSRSVPNDLPILVSSRSELHSQTRSQQDQLQLGSRDSAVSRLYLREYFRWTGTTRSVHQ